MNWYLKSQTNPWPWAVGAEVPPPPGESPVPAGYVRLYHYTNRETDPHESAESLRKEGIDISHAKGSTYGEPNVVWASTERPHDQKVFAEFAIAANDPRWAMGKPRSGQDIGQYESSMPNVYFNDSILPHEILAVHEPWHVSYRRVLSSQWLLEEVRKKAYGDLINDPFYGPAIVKIKAEFPRAT